MTKIDKTDLENIKLIRNVSEATLKKMKDINAKNNTDT